MKNNIIILLLLTVLSVICTSCEKYTADSENETVNKEANSTLTIRTRAAASNIGDNTEISYPVNIYVFNSKNTCVATTIINKEGTPISLKLPEGNYEIYAIAGADGNNYELPSKEEATKESVISLKDGSSHADLMTARNTINLAFGEENTLTLTLARKVMMLEEVTINNVPGNVNAVSVTITPIYRNILLNGKYSEEGSSHTVSLGRQAETGVWKNTSQAYLPEASGPATIKISLTTGSITKSYSYSCTDDLKANYKIRITGTYTNESGITLSGTITGVAWEGTKDIIFSFDENGSTTNDNGQGNESNGNENGDAPAPGTLYKGCYVLRSSTSGDNTTVTLVSVKSKNALTFTRGDQTSMKESVNNALKELATERITGWRLPYIEEITYVKENLETINENLINLNQTIIADKLGASLYSYYYQTADGNVSTYNMSRGDTDSNPNTGLKSCILRAFTTLTFTK